jgi:DNA-binding FadR family transcriptional regulator
MAGKAARNITPEAAAQLGRQIEKLEGLIDTPAAYVHEDVLFHDIIMRMSGDRLSKAIIDSVQSKAVKTYSYSGRLNVDHVRATHEAHKRVYEAIVAGDSEGAARAMREHIETSWRKRRPGGPEEKSA